MHSARIITGSLALASLSLLAAAPAMAHQCVNVDKQTTAGVQIVFDDAGPVWISAGLQKRIGQGLVDLETGEGFSGQVGFDVDGDGEADIVTFIVGPDGEIPLQAQLNGSDSHGILNICDAYAWICEA